MTTKKEEKDKNFEYSEENLDENYSFDELVSGIQEGKMLIGKLTDIITDSPFTFNSCANLDFKLDKLYGERDDALEDNKILKKCLYQQTKIISELNYGIVSLKEKLHRYQDQENTQINFSQSLSYGIEPLRRACSSYEQEFRRSIRALETLLSTVKSTNSTTHVTSTNTSRESSFCMESEICELIEICSSSSLLLKSVESNGVSPQINACLKNIETINAKLQHILAQICCDESMHDLR
ncbi:hypothetical protein HZS_358 [Henneguya salminicola]|nr:hypothetical protein HZS_358 [Henneguya salminicola]